jgi:hypothetical protein
MGKEKFPIYVALLCVVMLDLALFKVSKHTLCADITTSKSYLCPLVTTLMRQFVPSPVGLIRDLSRWRRAILG